LSSPSCLSCYFISESTHNQPPESYPAYPPHPAYLVILFQSPHTTSHPKAILLFYCRGHTPPVNPR
ncbi:MAG: hypothetical protein WCF65_08745, partial [Parachlamydiaceae bacterium]